MRQNRLCKITDIDYLTIPATVTVQMQDTNDFCGTELKFLQRINSKQELKRLKKKIEFEKQTEDLDLNDIQMTNSDSKSNNESEHASDQEVVNDMKKEHIHIPNVSTKINNKNTNDWWTDSEEDVDINKNWKPNSQRNAMDVD